MSPEPRPALVTREEVEPHGTAATEAGTEPPTDAVPAAPAGPPPGIGPSRVDEAVALAVPGLGTVTLGQVLKRPSLSRGGEAVVRQGVLARPGAGPEQVIVKSRPATAFGDEGFRRELAALSALDGLGPTPASPRSGRVPRLLRWWRDARGSHLLMETLPGTSVVDLLGALGGRDLEPELAAEVVERLGATIAALHERGFSHNDLSWGNVLVAIDATGAVADVALVDFGLATRLGEAAPRAATPGFIATRQWRDGIAVPENDTASLARVAYSLLTRINPSRADLEPVARIRRDVGERASQLLHRGITDTGSFTGGRGPALRFATELAASLRGVGRSEQLAELRRVWQLQLTTATTAARLAEVGSGLRHDLAPAERFAGLVEAARLWSAAAASGRVDGAGPEELRARAATALADAALVLRTEAAGPPLVPPPLRDFRSSDVDLFRDLHPLLADFLAHRGLPPVEVDDCVRRLWLTWADGFEPHLRRVREFRPGWVPVGHLEPPPPPPPSSPPWSPARPHPLLEGAPPHYRPPRPTPVPVAVLAHGACVAAAAAVLLAVTVAGLAGYGPDVPTWDLALAPAGALAIAGLLRLRLRRWRNRRRLVGRHPDAVSRGRAGRAATALLLAVAGVALLVAPLPGGAATSGDVAAVVLLGVAVLSLGAPTRGDTAAVLVNTVAVGLLAWAALATGLQTWLLHRAVPGLVEPAYALVPAFAWPERAGGSVGVGGDVDVAVGTGAAEGRELRTALRRAVVAADPTLLDVAGVGAQGDDLVVAASVAVPDDGAVFVPRERLVLLVPPDQAATGDRTVRLGDSLVGAWEPVAWSATDGGGAPEPGQLVRVQGTWDAGGDAPDRALALALLDADGRQVLAVASLTTWP